MPHHTGMALLAFVPDEMVRQLLPDVPSPVTSHTITDGETLRRELAETRARGYSVADETLEVGLVAIAAPVYNHDGQVVATLSIAGPKSRVTPGQVPEIGRQVMVAADRVSARLGFRL